MPFLHNLKQLREDYPMTIGELEEKSRVSRTTISKVEKLQQEARRSTVHKLAEALEAEPADLMDPDRQLSALLFREMNRKTTLANLMGMRPETNESREETARLLKALGMQPGNKGSQDLEERTGRERLIENLMKRGRTREEVEEEIKRVEKVARKGAAR